MTSEKDTEPHRDLNALLEEVDRIITNETDKKLLNQNKEIKSLLQEIHTEVAHLIQSKQKSGGKWTVYVDDNYHYMEADERYSLGEFDHEEDAVVAAKKIVDDFLDRGYEPGITAESLLDGYKSFGEDPWIPGSSFSAWEYAKLRCTEICGKKED